MRTWYAIDIIVDPGAAEAVESGLNWIDVLGTEIDGLRKKKGEPVMVTGFFDRSPDIAEVTGAVGKSLSIYGFSLDAVRSLSERIVEETDWLAEWKRHWRATEVGPFVIAPPWATVEADDKTVIRIEPNMAFGTGTHETTQLCLRALSKHYRPGQTVLDVGTGTGILAIAAANLGATTILALDTDADSVRIARENAVANGVGGQIIFLNNAIDNSTAAFDFICANLTLDVIVPILPLLVEKCRGILLLSGILTEQREVIAAELSKFQVSNLQSEAAGEWIAITAWLDERPM